MCKGSYQEVLSSITVFENHLKAYQVLNQQVSSWPIGMHIQHCCLATIGICSALEESTPPAPKNKWSLLRTLVLLTGKIPRGKGKAPEISIPDPNLTEESLLASIDAAKEAIESANKLNKQNWFKHHVFGYLKKGQALRFIGIHNKHHLGIIREILASQPVPTK